MVLHNLAAEISSKAHGVIVAALLSISASAHADEMLPDFTPRSESADFVKSYALGINEYRTDDFTKMTGWRVSKSWHFGYQQGEDDGISLVWQHAQDQMSISANGIRFTRRF